MMGGVDSRERQGEATRVRIAPPLARNDAGPIGRRSPEDFRCPIWRVKKAEAGRRIALIQHHTRRYNDMKSDRQGYGAVKHPWLSMLQQSSPERVASYVPRRAGKSETSERPGYRDMPTHEQISCRWMVLQRHEGKTADGVCAHACMVRALAKRQEHPK